MKDNSLLLSESNSFLIKNIKNMQFSNVKRVIKSDLFPSKAISSLNPLFDSFLAIHAKNLYKISICLSEIHELLNNTESKTILDAFSSVPKFTIKLFLIKDICILYDIISNIPKH